MRTSNFGNGWRATGFFRLCMGIIVSLTLALGGIALNRGPVQAATFDPPTTVSANLTECQSWTYPFTVTPGCTPPGKIFYWQVGVWPSWADIDFNTGLLTVCPPPGVAGTSTALLQSKIMVSEYDSARSIPCLLTIDYADIDLTVSNAFTPASCNITIDPSFYPVAWEDMPFLTTLSATGGTGSYSWQAPDLPVGLSIESATGIISGTPALGTCGFYPVTATVTDTGGCVSCCPPVSRDFILIVDCLANYDPGGYGSSGGYDTSADYDFTVEIGTGLAAGQTNVVIDGTQETTLAGGGTETFTTQQGLSHSVTVDLNIAGTDPKTRFAVKGSNEIMVSETNTAAYFDYAQEVLIDTGSDPSGISQPGGSGWYAIGDYFSTTTASPVNSVNQQGTRYIFRAWRLPDGGTNPSRDLIFTVNRSGAATALYDTYYQLRLKSDYPLVDESSWELKGSTANYNLALQAAPMQGFWGALGGVLRPVNSSGTHLMDNPYTQNIMWSDDYTIPIVIIVVTLIIIAAAVFFILRSRKKQGGAGDAAGGTGGLSQPPADEVTTEVKTLPVETAKKRLPKVAAVEPVKAVPALSAKPAAKKALAKAETKAEPDAEQKDKPNFCAKCGSTVDEGADFCKKCGNKLA